MLEEFYEMLELIIVNYVEILQFSIILVKQCYNSTLDDCLEILNKHQTIFIRNFKNFPFHFKYLSKKILKQIRRFMKQLRILKQQINQRQFLNIPFITNLLNQQQQLPTSIFI